MVGVAETENQATSWKELERQMDERFLFFQKQGLMVVLTKRTGTKHHVINARRVVVPNHRRDELNNLLTTRPDLFDLNGNKLVLKELGPWNIGGQDGTAFDFVLLVGDASKIYP